MLIEFMAVLFSMLFLSYSRWTRVISEVGERALLTQNRRGKLVGGKDARSIFKKFDVYGVCVAVGGGWGRGSECR